MARNGPLVVYLIAVSFVGHIHCAHYLGKFLGKLSELHHAVSGEVYAVDGRTLYIKDFTYDGQGPAAYFFASSHKTADNRGFRLRHETADGRITKRYRKEGVVVSLPEGKTLQDIKIFYVWCEEFEVNFGDVKIPRNFDFPKPQKIDPLNGVHAIASDNIVVVDAQTLLIPNLSYDGEAPDAKFWAGYGTKPSPQGIRIPDENGKEIPLRRYDRKTVVLTLPGDLTIFDIGHFGIWCEQFTVDFGHVQVPKNLNVPPSLKMLGVSPQSRLNCEVLNDAMAFEVRWAVAGESIVLQLVAKLGDGEYMSFGLSGDETRNAMVGGDVVVAWIDKETLKGYAEDYYLADKSQCSGPTGSCPDNRLSPNTDNIRLLNAALVNGYSIVTYQRPLKASDEYDQPIYTNRSQAIIWAIGPLNQRKEVSFHSSYLKTDTFINFGRTPIWNCPMPDNEQHIPSRSAATLETRSDISTQTEADIVEELTTQIAPRRTSERRRVVNRNPVRHVTVQDDDSEISATKPKEQSRNRIVNRGRGSSNSNSRTPPPPTPVKKRDAWVIPPIQCYEPEDGVFYAQMGPTGGKRGYPAITGHVGWGISWYINGLLIPEINVVRGKTYTFVIEGGTDSEVSAKYHPFYITDDPVGGYAYKTPEEKEKVNIFAGVRRAKDGSEYPTGVGRLCHWTQTGDLEADDFESFGGYQRTLELKCDQGEPGVIQWTPDENTPDTVYYQCFTHRYLGWKINVHDTCDEQSAASELKPTVVEAPKENTAKSDVDLEESPSIQIETRVMPNAIYTADAEDKPNQSTFSEIETSLFNLDLTPSSEKTQMQLPNQSVPTQSQQSSLAEPQTVNDSYFSQHSMNTTEESSTTINNYIKSTDNVPKPYLDLSPKEKRTSVILQLPVIMPPKYTPQTILRTPSDPVHIVVKQLHKTTNKIPVTRVSPMRRPIHYMPRKKIVQRPVKLHLNDRLPSVKPVYLSDLSNHRLASVQLRIPTESNLSKIKIISGDLYAPSNMSVEVSPQQASTEREPQVSYSSEASMLPLAVNTGFKPESVVVEGGFIPIVNSDIQNRADIQPELQIEGEVGERKIEGETKYETLKEIQEFEPIFVPSPTLKPKRKHTKVFKRPQNKKTYFKLIMPRNLIDSPIEPIASADERVESYYLPPSGQKPVLNVRHPSAIDIEEPSNIDLVESPPDVVVTYDGKKVSGASLTARLHDRTSILDQRASKAAEFIKARPQFAPFKGELPPLDTTYVNKNVPQLQSSHIGTINRGLDAPPSPPQGPTRLQRVRSRRAAHHTAEHTAQQEQEKQGNTTQTNSSNILISQGIIILNIVVVTFCTIY